MENSNGKRRHYEPRGQNHIGTANAITPGPAGVFTSTGSTHGGQETTLLTMMVPVIYLGMVTVGVPYSTDGMLHTEARGGYGATTIAGPRGELQPTKEDLAIASALGQRVATIAKKLRTEVYNTKN